MGNLKDGPAVGILANPAAGRDIRRLVAQASVFPIAEKRNMITRLFSGLGAGGVKTVYMMPDESGIANRVRHALEGKVPEGQTWPQVVFLDMHIEDRPIDTLVAVEKMVELGVGGIVVMGGDGTNRLVAQVAGEVPMAPLSTGTNNVFPAMREATVVGLAAALVATGQVGGAEATQRNKLLRVEVDGVARDIALVDLCVSTAIHVGAKALWRAEGLDQLFVTFAEADAIGLSSIAGLLAPISRRESHGLRVDLAPPDKAPMVLSVPLAPGLICDIGVAGMARIEPGAPMPVRIPRGVLALDGEREVTFEAGENVAIRLELDGPLTIDVASVMECAAREGLLAKGSIPA